MSLPLQYDSGGSIHPTILNEANPDPQDLPCRLRLETSPSIQREQQHIAGNLAFPGDAEDSITSPVSRTTARDPGRVNGQTWNSRNGDHSDQTVGLLNRSLLPLKIASVTMRPSRLAHSPENPPILHANVLGQTQ
jgi:hypothetical protein